MLCRNTKYKKRVVLYVHIKLFITDKFNAKILDTIKYPEIYWVKLAFKNYTAMKESEKEQLEFRLLKEYMKKILYSFRGSIKRLYGKKLHSNY